MNKVPARIITELNQWPGMDGVIPVLAELANVSDPDDLDDGVLGMQLVLDFAMTSALERIASEAATAARIDKEYDKARQTPALIGAPLPLAPPKVPAAFQAPPPEEGGGAGVAILKGVAGLVAALWNAGGKDVAVGIANQQLKEATKGKKATPQLVKGKDGNVQAGVTYKGETVQGALSVTADGEVEYHLKPGNVDDPGFSQIHITAKETKISEAGRTQTIPTKITWGTFFHHWIRHGSPVFQNAEGVITPPKVRTITYPHREAAFLRERDLGYRFHDYTPTQLLFRLTNSTIPPAAVLPSILSQDKWLFLPRTGALFTDLPDSELLSASKSSAFPFFIKEPGPENSVVLAAKGPSIGEGVGQAGWYTCKKSHIARYITGLIGYGEFATGLEWLLGDRIVPWNFAWLPDGEPFNAMKRIYPLLEEDQYRIVNVGGRNVMLPGIETNKFDSLYQALSGRNFGQGWIALEGGNSLGWRATEGLLGGLTTGDLALETDLALKDPMSHSGIMDVMGSLAQKRAEAHIPYKAITAAMDFTAAQWQEKRNSPVPWPESPVTSGSISVPTHKEPTNFSNRGSVIMSPEEARLYTNSVASLGFPELSALLSAPAPLTGMSETPLTGLLQSIFPPPYALELLSLIEDSVFQEAGVTRSQLINSVQTILSKLDKEKLEQMFLTDTLYHLSVLQAMISNDRTTELFGAPAASVVALRAAAAAKRLKVKSLLLARSPQFRLSALKGWRIFLRVTASPKTMTIARAAMRGLSIGTKATLWGLAISAFIEVIDDEPWVPESVRGILNLFSLWDDVKKESGDDDDEGTTLGIPAFNGARAASHTTPTYSTDLRELIALGRALKWRNRTT